MDRFRHSIGVPIALCLVATFALGSLSLTPPRVVAASAPLAAPTLAVTPTTLAPGDTMTVSGAGFVSSEAVGVLLSPQTTPITSIQADANGVVTKTLVTVPMTFTPGMHTLRLSGMTSHRTTADTQLTLTPITPTVAVTPTTLAPGATATISATGFQSNEAVDLFISPQTTPITTVLANAQGALGPVAVIVPASFAIGAHTLHLVGQASHRATANTAVSLTPITPTLSVTPTALVAGNKITVSGANFVPYEVVDVMLSPKSLALASLQADAHGNIPATALTVPTTYVVGPHTLTLTGRTSKRTVSQEIRVDQPAAAPAPPTATLVSQPTATNRGGLVTISGSNFAANESINVTIQGLSTPLAVLKANAQGQLTPTGIAIPYNVSIGAHVLQVTGTTSKRTATINISVVALAPSIGFNASSLAPGKTVTVTGKGFGRNEQVTLSLNGSALMTTPSVVTTNNGTFTATFVVPNSLLRGANTISAIGNQSRVSTVSNLQGMVPVAATLYFAGATTMAGERAMLAILNTNAQPARIDLTFFYKNGAPGHASLDVAAHTRSSADLNRLAGGNRAFGVELTSDRAVTAQLRVTRSGKDGYSLLGVSAPNTTWYLAEGYTGLTFHEMLSLVNPGSTVSQVQLRLLPFGGRSARTVVVNVAPQSTQLVDVNSYMPNQSLSVIADASAPIVLARTLTFGANGYGITAKTGINTPATSWIFAEGTAAARGTATARFQTYLTILNPNGVGTYVTASFYGQTGGSLGSRTVYVAGNSRANIKLNNFLNADNIASVLTSNIPVVVERPEYAGSPNAKNVAGNVVFGRNGAGLAWTFPGGNLLSRSEVLRLYNPSSRPAEVEATFYGSNGMMVTKRLSVPPTVQYIVDVRSLAPGLSIENGITLRSVNGQGFVAEQTNFAANYSTMQGSQGFAS